jgi:enoyl-CoA hydratase/carnithine racemase
VLTEPGEALAGALELADRVNANAPLAVRESLAVVFAGIKPDPNHAWGPYDAAHARLLASDDLREGLEAFFARPRRAPQWRGR